MEIIYNNNINGKGGMKGKCLVLIWCKYHWRKWNTLVEINIENLDAYAYHIIQLCACVN